MKNKKTIYAVEINAGQVPDHYSFIKFVTPDKEVANKYKEKFDRIITKAKEHNKRFEDEGWIKKEFRGVYQRWERINDLDYVIIKELELSVK